MDRIHPDIPALKNCVLAFCINAKKQTENVLIGELQEIRQAAKGLDPASTIIDIERPIGSFVIDCCHQIAPVTMNQLNDLYKSDNLCFKFFALRIWQEYMSYQGSEKHPCIKNQDTASAPFLNGFIQNLTLLVHLSLESIIQKGQSVLSDSPLDYFDNTLLNGSAKLFYNNKNGVQEYIVADADLMPVVLYSLRYLYGNHQYFQRCKICNRLFLAHTANIPTLCSDECRRTQRRLNKRKYDSIKKDIWYEKDYKNSYMYWYNKLGKLKKTGAVNYQSFEKAFHIFCMDARAKKRAVKNGGLSALSFNDWMITQKTKADQLVSQILEEQSRSIGSKSNRPAEQ